MVKYTTFNGYKVLAGVKWIVDKKTITITSHPKRTDGGKFPYKKNKPYTKTWKNYCPRCKKSGKCTGIGQGKGEDGPEGGVRCNACDADYCFSGDTEVFLKNSEGNYCIMTMSELYNSLEKYFIQSLNIKTNQVEWKPIVNKFKNPKKMIYDAYIGNNECLNTTIDHEFFRLNNKNDKVTSKVQLGDATRVVRRFEFDKIKYHDNPLYRLIGLYIGDGSMYSNNKKSIYFNFSKEDKNIFLIDLMNSLNINYNTLKDIRGNYRYSIIFSENQFLENLFDYKELISPIINNQTAFGLLEGLISSDGTKADSTITFTTTNKNILKIFKTCCRVIGLNYTIYREDQQYNKQKLYRVRILANEDLSFLKLSNRFDNILYKEKKQKKNGRAEFKIINEKQVEETYNITVDTNNNFFIGDSFNILVANCGVSGLDTINNRTRVRLTKASSSSNSSITKKLSDLKAKEKKALNDIKKEYNENKLPKKNMTLKLPLLPDFKDGYCHQLAPPLISKDLIIFVENVEISQEGITATINDKLEPPGEEYKPPSTKKNKNNSSASNYNASSDIEKKLMAIGEGLKKSTETETVRNIYRNLETRGKLGFKYAYYYDWPGGDLNKLNKTALAKRWKMKSGNCVFFAWAFYVMCQGAGVSVEIWHAVAQKGLLGHVYNRFKGSVYDCTHYRNHAKSRKIK